METLQIPTRLREDFIQACRQLQLDANRVLEQLIARFVAQPPAKPIEDWIRETAGNIRLSGDDELVDGLTVAEYFSLTEEQRDALWEKWDNEADKKLQNMTARKVDMNANIAG
jgi:hypothetical protein